MTVRRLYFREGKHDKVYVATLDNGTVKFEWGRRGASMQSKTFGPMSHGEASDMWSAKIQEKINKGYRENPGERLATINPERLAAINPELLAAIAPNVGGPILLTRPLPAARIPIVPRRSAPSPAPHPAPQPAPVKFGRGARKFRFND